MSLAQQLLVRTLISRFWKEPYKHKLIPWGTALHDRFMLPHFVELDWQDVLQELRDAGYAFKHEWFAPHFEFRFPLIGSVTAGGITVELRHALEPWNVLGEEASGGGHGSQCRFLGGTHPGQDLRELRATASSCSATAAGFPNQWAESDTAPGSRHPACIPTSRFIRRWSLTSWIRGRPVPSAAARITSRIPADAPMKSSRSTPTRRRAGVSRGLVTSVTLRVR